MPELNFYATDAADPGGAAGQVLQPQYSTVVPGYNYGDGNTPGGTGFMEFGSGTPGSLPFRVDQNGNVTATSVTGATGTTDWINVKAYGAIGNGITDDTAAIQAAINAAAKGNVVYFPTGKYEISVPLTITIAGVTLMGDGGGNGYEGGGADFTIIDAMAGFTGTAMIEVTGAPDFHMFNLEIHGHNIATGTQQGLTLDNGSGSALLQNIAFGYIPGNALVNNGDGITMIHTGSFQAGKGGSGGWGFTINNADSTFIGCLSSGSGSGEWNITDPDNNIFTGCRGEDGNGYGFYVTGAISANCVFTGCSTDGNELAGFAAYSVTGLGPIQINACAFREDGTTHSLSYGTGSGILVYDCAVPVIIGGGTCVNPMSESSSVASSPHYAITMTGSAYVSVGQGNYGTDPTGIPFNWDGSGVFRVGSDVTVSTVVGGSFPGTPTYTYSNPSYPNPSPQDQNLQFWTNDPATSVNSNAPTSGTIRLCRIPVTGPKWVTNILVSVVTVGTTLTSGENYVGLYTENGTLIASSADQTSAWASSGTKTIALAGGPYLIQPGYIYVAILSNGVLAPAFGCATAQSPNSLNAGLSAGSFRFCNGPATQASLPGSITMSGTSAIQYAYWAAGS